MVIGEHRHVRLALALLVLLCGMSHGAVGQNATQPAQIDRNGTLILIRSALIALQQADETGNYTVLRDLGAPGFEQANTAARLGDIFANLRTKNVDLAGILVLDPQLTILPQIDRGGIMHMAGFFPSVPVQINFELAYAPANGRWRLFGVSVGLGSSSPVAPMPVRTEGVPPNSSLSSQVPPKPTKIPTKPEHGHIRARPKASVPEASPPPPAVQ